MNEVKKPKKPLLYYYGIVLLVILLLNVIVMPAIRQLQIKEVDYGTFMTMVNEKEVGKVEVQDNRILFTDKDGKIKSTAPNAQVRTPIAKSNWKAIL